MDYELILKYFPEFSQRQREQMKSLYGLYKDWNEKINVISRKDIDQLYLHHILHSLALAKFAQDNDSLFTPGCSILDAGTGGGFPGIPLAIAFPDVKFTLCDSIAKKIRVASEIATAINLENVQFRCDRMENLNTEFDFIVSRAVTELKKFIPWVEKRYRNGILFLKGGDIEHEIEECSRTLEMRSSLFVSRPVNDYFSEEYFNGKAVIYVKKFA